MTPKTLFQKLEDQIANASSLKQEKEEERDAAIAAMRLLEEYETKAEELLPELEELAAIADNLWTYHEVDVS